jgi:purine-binding chemotaxis protein CheW
MHPDHTAPEASRRGPQRAEGKYLALALGEEEYGIPVLDVREIVGLMPITRVPNASPNVLGVMNLRGKVVPVVDLRARLGAQMLEATRQTCIVVVKPEGSPLIGILVDQVLEVMQPAEADLDRSPSVAHGCTNTAAASPSSTTPASGNQTSPTVAWA